METIAHRELRNNSSAVLARVAAGEAIEVTNHGVVAAVLVPAGTSVLDRLRLSGRMRPARRSPRFRDIHRAEGLSSREVLDDLRGNR